ncbi:MAG: serine/threonine protein kinase [Deltaproteobacteria bacterium]|nr:serine/threonine protein kinase [Deltaproteobacteria bacterium]
MSRDLVGATLGGRYQLTSLLGKGGMGAVYEARELSLGRIVAIKVLNDPSSTPSMAERFYREAVSAARLAHVNIIQVTDFSPATRESPAFLVMEHLKGSTLASALSKARSFTVGRSLGVIAQVASALGAAHAAGVIHRDIKPHNLFLQDLDGTDFVKVFDFGIAKVLGESQTTTGAILGSVSYMSPEQAMGEPIGPTTDVWSMGVVLFEMLTGTLPIKHRGLGEIASAIMRGEIASIRKVHPSTPEPVAQIVERALSRDPRARFHDGTQMFHAVQSARSALGADAAVPTRRAVVIMGHPSTADPPAEPTMPSHSTVRPSRRGQTLEMPLAPKRPAGGR